MRRQATKGKVQISDELKNELATNYCYCITEKLEEYDMASAMVINLDKNHSKFVLAWLQQNLGT